MELKKLLSRFAAGTVAALASLMPIAAHAQSSSGQLAATATVVTSAALTLKTGGSTDTTLTFPSLIGGQSYGPTEGAVTIGAQVTTTSGNASAVIDITSDADLTGSTDNTDLIPFTQLTYTTADAGTTPQTATWLTPALGGGATTWSVLAELTPGSGTYAGTQTFTLAVPATSNADTYTGNVYYRIYGF
jgi:hypothetical protein